jgi:hypothetical protein
VVKARIGTRRWARAFGRVKLRYAVDLSDFIPALFAPSRRFLRENP